jgi:hypothetical protein
VQIALRERRTFGQQVVLDVSREERASSRLETLCWIMRIPEVEVRNMPALDADNTEEVARRHLECLSLPRQHREIGNFGKLIRAAPPLTSPIRERIAVSLLSLLLTTCTSIGPATVPHGSSRLRELDRQFVEGADPA